MASSGEAFHRLKVVGPCDEAWETMLGDERRRHCERCDREVIDLSRLTAREIAARLEAGRGRMCARVSRSGDRISIAPPPPREPATLDRPLLTSPGRGLAMAAGLVAAWLGGGSAGAAAAEPPTEPAAAVGAGHGATAGSTNEAASAGRDVAPSALPGALLEGWVTLDGDTLPGVNVRLIAEADGRVRSTVSRADGSFAFDALEPGHYRLTGDLEGVAIVPLTALDLRAGETASATLTAILVPIQETVTVGIVVAAPEPLHRRFEASDIVVAALVGPSVLVDREAGHGNLVEVETRLQVSKVWKGRVVEREIAVRHSIYLEEGDALTPDALGDFAAGRRVLAFLDQRGERGGRSGRALYELANGTFDLKRLGDAELRAYGDRLDALVKIERRLPLGGGVEPDDLIGWLVGTAEDPLTRAEAVDVIDSMLAALDERARARGRSAEDEALALRESVERARAGGIALDESLRPALGAAFLTDAGRARLTRALARTETLDSPSLALFALVRRWDGEAATVWIARRLRTLENGEIEEPDDFLWRLADIAETFASERLIALADDARERFDEVDERWSDDETEATERVRDELRREVVLELAERFAAELGGGR